MIQYLSEVHIFVGAVDRPSFCSVLIFVTAEKSNHSSYIIHCKYRRLDSEICKLMHCCGSRSTTPSPLIRTTIWYRMVEIVPRSRPFEHSAQNNSPVRNNNRGNGGLVGH